MSKKILAALALGVVMTSQASAKALSCDLTCVGESPVVQKSTLQYCALDLGDEKMYAQIGEENGQTYLGEKGGFDVTPKHLYIETRNSLLALRLEEDVVTGSGTLQFQIRGKSYVTKVKCTETAN